MKKKFLIFTAILFTSFLNAFEFKISTDDGFYFSEKETEIFSKKANLKINTNIYGANLYLNGNFKGQAPLTILDLVPGGYTVRLEKTGYKTEESLVFVNQGMENEYFIYLHENSGRVKIKNFESSLLIFVDGKKYDEPDFVLPEGNHKILIRRFGYSDYEENFYLEMNKEIEITPVNEKVDFYISGLSLSKQKINPLYGGALGSVEIISSASDSGSAVIEIEDGSKKVVYSEKIKFETWENILTWKGCDSNGNKLSSGEYTVFLRQDDKFFSESVILDCSGFLHHGDISAAGSGYGPLMAAFSYPSQSGRVKFNGGVSFRQGEGVSNIPFGLTGTFCPLNFLEINAGFSLDAEPDDIPVNFNTSVKFAFNKKISDTEKICYAFSAKYGASGISYYEPLGINTGYGLGGAFALGYDSLHFYSGFTTEFNAGSDRGDLSYLNNNWKNGITISIMPVYFVSLDLWGALHSYFVSDDSFWARGFETGGALNFYIPDLFLILTTKCNVLFYESETYCCLDLGLKFVF